MIRRYSQIACLVGLFVCIVSSGIFGGGLTEVATNLPDFNASAMCWGDYDNDGDMDLALTGRWNQHSSDHLGRIYRNDGDSLTQINSVLAKCYSGSLNWVDYDNDGDLDLFQTGIDSSNTKLANLYRNEGSDTFVAVSFPGPGVFQSMSSWSDFDGDGDYDLAYSGTGPVGPDLLGLYRNEGNGNFTAVSHSLPGFRRGSIDWGDYDSDGDADMLLTGISSTFQTFAGVFRNDGESGFTEISAPFLPQYDGEARWGDFDSDGDLDIFINGSNETSSMFFSKVYRNDGGDVFVDIGATLAPAGEGSTLDIGDVDVDGSLDVFMLAVFFSDDNLFYHSADSVYVASVDSITASCCGSSALVDLDGDGDLDIVYSDFLFGVHYFRNDSDTPNSLPSAPSGLEAQVFPDSVELSWAAASDSETTAAGLTYNVRVGTSPGSEDIVSAMSDGSTGFHRIVEKGNADHRLNLSLWGLPAGVYFWSVQSIDNCFTGSPFAAEESFTIGQSTPLCGDANNDGSVGISDAVFIINYIFGGGPAPNPVEVADVNCSGSVSVGDAVYLINFIFGGGAAPCESCR